MSLTYLRNELAALGARRTGHRRPPRLVVIGNIGNGNTGDEALLTVTLAALPPAAAVTVLSRSPAATTALHHAQAVALTGRAAAAAVARADGLVVVGGGMFGPGLPPLVRCLPLLLRAAAAAGRDVALVGIGAYPGMPATTLTALRRVAAASYSVTVRDPDSGRLLDPQTPPVCVGDLALHLPAAPAADAADRLRSAGIDPRRPLLLLTPKAGTTPDKTDRLVVACARAARYWAERGGAVAALAFADRADHTIPATDTDTALVLRIAAGAGLPVPVLGPNLPPSLAKAIVAQATAVVGLRFHGLVFAAAAGVSATSFDWEAKTAAFLREHDLAAQPDACPGGIATWLHHYLPAPPAVRPPLSVSTH